MKFNMTPPPRSGKMLHSKIRHVVIGNLLLLVTLILAACSSTVSQAPELIETTTVWSGIDVGFVGSTGSTEAENNGTSVAVLGAGQDIWGTGDSFHMASNTLVGDGAVITRVNEVEEIDEWTKAGIMMRQDLSPDSPNVYIHITPRNGSVMQARVSQGAETIEPGYIRDLQPPTWLKLERQGSTFIGSYSSNGQTWTELGRVTVNMSEEIYVGLAVTSKDPSTRARAEFEGVSLAAEAPIKDPPGQTPTPPDQTPTPPNPEAPGGDRVHSTFEVDNSVIPNPERGWYFERTTAEYQAQAAAGFRLAMKYVNLSSYRNTATLPASVLNDLGRDLESARQAGLKIILRFAYNRSRDADAPINIVMSHISQVGPFIRENSDVIAVVQAGFIGAWGEWHSTTNNLLTLENRSLIANALLDEVPLDRMIQLRKPLFVRDLFPSEPDIGTNRRFDDSDQSRVGIMNDCFLTSASDTGTYGSPADYALFENISKFTVIGGETCDLAGLVPRNDCPTALQELALYSWDYLNHDFWSAIVNRWRQNGCYDEITSRLGYRYELQEASAPTHLERGKGLDLEITVRNSGFGKLYNPRPVQALMVHATTGAVTVIELENDARQVMPLAGATATVNLTAAVPTTLAPGSYFIYLRLPDASARLQDNPMYSIRLANRGVWDQNLGANDLGLWVNVE